MAAIAAKEKAIEGGEEQARIHRIRFTVTSRNVEALERVCADLKRNAEDKGLKGQVSGPVRLPTKVLHITTRKTPCGEGSKTWDRFEMRIHKRILDMHAPAAVVRHVTTITVDPSVRIEVTIADSKRK